MTRRDRGSVALLDLVVAAMIMALLTAALATLLTSAYSATNSISRRADIAQRTADLTTRMREALSGSTSAGSCAARLDPITAAPILLANCERITRDPAVLVSATATKVCALSMSTDGAAMTATTLLVAPNLQCLELSAKRRLTSTLVAPNTADYTGRTWTAAPTQTELLLVGATITPVDNGSAPVTPAFSYFAADGTELVPATGTPLALSDAQRALVRVVRFKATVQALRTKVLEPIVIDIALGAARFAQEQRWQGR